MTVTEENHSILENLLRLTLEPNTRDLWASVRHVTEMIDPRETEVAKAKKTATAIVEGLRKYTSHSISPWSFRSNDMSHKTDSLDLSHKNQSVLQGLTEEDSRNHIRSHFSKGNYKERGEDARADL